jgi:type IV pilus assembly protein PilM
MPIPKKNQLVGLDIGSHSIKLVEIDDSKRGRILKNFGIIGLPPDAIVEGSIKEMEIVSSAIKTLLQNLKVKNKHVATSISGFSVIVKKITVSSKEESELETTIQDEAEQYIPFDINEVNLDFDILSGGEKPAEGEEESEKAEESDQMEVMLVAAKKDIIDDYASLLQFAGLTPMVLDVDAFALQNAFEMSADKTEGCYALVNVGAEELGINAIKNGVSLFARDSSYGGSQITDAIMSQFKLSFEDAEKMKLGGAKIGKEKPALEEIFTSVVSEWVQEIKRALDFVASTYSDETIEKILVSGGACRIPGFQKYLKLETDIPVEELNPFANLVIDDKFFDAKYLKHMAPQAAVAVGLALRSIGDK